MIIHLNMFLCRFLEIDNVSESEDSLHECKFVIVAILLVLMRRSFLICYCLFFFINVSQVASKYRQQSEGAYWMTVITKQSLYVSNI